MYTVYAENVGLIEMARIRSRWITAVTGAVLIVLGCLPGLGTIVASLPDPVVGAAALVMFAMITAVGIRILKKVDFNGTHNLLILAVSLAAGMVPVTAPTIYHRLPDSLQIILGSAITSTAACAFALNLLFNHTPRKGQPSPGQDPVAHHQPSTTHLSATEASLAP
ncbi:solute carrier family 23 protein [Streptomyces gardneri]|uniref:Uncharacterized protein n=1 Tax=Streptomyces gardneri TaxID=66892 RepID=A0A4Y3REF1_9ACTN|nr:solute carrier family 23 protein [Streptomyces gardneri]GEB56181.1 hypothetical protein SGA01_17860 [Streptomyces gardneri]GHG98980.1 hypothetical protein GCM10017674_33230 [Streptomyces gardneri]